VTDVFGIWMTVHGVVMVVGGVAFGLAELVPAAAFVAMGFSLMMPASVASAG
jgi:hypothetical protein